MTVPIFLDSQTLDRPSRQTGPGVIDRHRIRVCASIALVGWYVVLTDEVSEWFLELAVLDPETAQLVEAAIDHLALVGPALARPLVDHIKASRHHNMKELRPASAGSTKLRILFAFDPDRQAILLVAGDKAGSWKRWYEVNIPIADDRFDRWLRKGM